jgi:hypothetical protein
MTPTSLRGLRRPQQRQTLASEWAGGVVRDHTICGQQRWSIEIRCLGQIEGHERSATPGGDIDCNHILETSDLSCEKLTDSVVITITKAQFARGTPWNHSNKLEHYFSSETSNLKSILHTPSNNNRLQSVFAFSQSACPIRNRSSFLSAY